MGTNKVAPLQRRLAVIASTTRARTPLWMTCNLRVSGRITPVKTLIIQRTQIGAGYMGPTLKPTLSTEHGSRPCWNAT